MTRRGTLSGFGDGVTFPESKVERAPRIGTEDDGFLDLARSKDGRELWTRRSWDDGTVDVLDLGGTRVPVGRRICREPSQT